MKGNTLILLLLAGGLIGIGAITAGAWWFLRYSEPSLPASLGNCESEPAPHRATEHELESARRAVAPNGLIALNIDRFNLGMGRYPFDLNELVSEPAEVDTGRRWDGPYINNPKLLIDPWDRPFRYVYPGVHNEATYDLWTVGFDGIDGTGDDEGNW